MARLVAYKGYVPSKLDEQEGFIHDLLKKNQEIDADKSIVGYLLDFPVADESAYYLVVKEKPLTLAYIPVFDNYLAHPATIREFRAEDVRRIIGLRKISR